MKNCCQAVLTLFACVTLLLGCQDDKAKTRDFSSPDEYMDNPSIDNAFDESNMDVNLGSDPPPIAGRYRIEGSVVDSSQPSFIGTPVGSDGCLYNQTYSGRIDFAELAQDLSATAQGNYVTGSGSQFSIWQEGDASGSGCVQHNAFILSGTKLANGDLQGEGLTVVLEASGCGAVTAGFWYKTSLTMSLECDCSGLSDLYNDCSSGSVVGTWDQTAATDGPDGHVFNFETLTFSSDGIVIATEIDGDTPETDIGTFVTSGNWIQITFENWLPREGTFSSTLLELDHVNGWHLTYQRR